MNPLFELASQFTGMFIASAPPLLIGLFLAGFFHTFLSAHVVEKYLKRPGFASVLRASLAGIPLPLCSCSVIPVGMALRRGGASRGATASFLLSTPEIGIDSFLLSAGLLGPEMAFTRMAVAIVIAVAVGTLIDRFCREPGDPGKQPQQGECCECGGEAIVSGPANEGGAASGILGRMRAGARYGFGPLLDDLALYLLIGLAAAAAILTFLPPGILEPGSLGKNTSLAVFFLLSVPSYVCAASSTPVAAALLERGASPGAILVFLLAGPATNLPTVSTIRGELGKSALAWYLSVVVLATLLAGWLVNQLLPGLVSAGTIAAHVHDAPHTWEIGAAAVFGLFWVRSLARRFAPRFRQGGSEAAAIRN